MGGSASLARVLRAIEDDDLVKLIEEAYTVDPQRIERAFAVAKTRYLETAKGQLARDGAVHGDAEGSAALSTLGVLPGASSLLITKELGAIIPAGANDQQLSHPRESARGGGNGGGAGDNALNVGKDPMNALWNFEGHTLRELLPLDKNPQHAPASSSSDGDDAGIASKQLDEEGNPLMYGSCGRDKRYARCSVCYFRGLRCNAAHYCGCCQRPVCIRPRKYPNEEHPKICWNVLHMDKDMISRVEKKKRRRLQAALVAATSTSGAAPPPLKSEAATAAIAVSPRHSAASAAAVHGDDKGTTALNL